MAFDGMEMSVEELTSRFNEVGFEDSKVKEIVKNKKVSASLFELINDCSIQHFDKPVRNLLHGLATSLKGQQVAHLSWIVDAIIKGDLKTSLQVDAALKYLIKHQKSDSAVREEMESESGVGSNVTEEDVRASVVKYLSDNHDVVVEQRYKLVPSIFANVKNMPELRWAEPRFFKPIIDDELMKIIGPKGEQDVIKKTPSEKKQGKKDKEKVANSTPEVKRSMFTEGFLGDLHKVGENPQAYPELMIEHLKATGGKVHTRFPPEPNGYLHIGHSKAIMVNFGYAKYNGGVCYLRFDDTNPEAEAPEYFESIKRMVAWLGFEPWKITYSSDYFGRLYELAEILIEHGKGYVCHCSAEQIKRGRGINEDGMPGGERTACIHRERSVEDNLKAFRNMRAGHYKPGEAILRMKQDLSSPSPQMWDLIAYRVLDAPHPRTGSDWKIYPTYDFTHCLVDSLENITHSLCTTEFYLSRESYEWLCDQVHVFRPAQREYGRLNITGTVLSKRKIAKLVDQNFVRGWDDPRLFTLEAIRRRGIPPGAILTFVNTLGVTTSVTNIQVVRFESAIRKYLEDTTPRLMFVLDPIEVVVDNLEDDYEELVSIPYRAGNNEFGERNVPFTNKFFIEKSDFSEDTGNGEFFRLTPGQSVGLVRVPFTVSYLSAERNSTGDIVRIHVKYNKDQKIKPKAYIQWVPYSKRYNSPLRVHETRVYNQLFKSENPSAHPDGYLKDINPESEIRYTNSMIEHNFREVQERSPWVLESLKSSDFYVAEDPNSVETCRFQGMRVGYFCVDKDSKHDKIILNRIVSLKESVNK